MSDTILDRAWRAFSAEEEMGIPETEKMMNDNDIQGHGRITDAERDFGMNMGPRGQVAGEVLDAAYYDTVQHCGAAITNASTQHQVHEFED